jgi:hypothetical protein
MEKYESQQFRDELAKKIKESPQGERKEILEKAKETPEYWQARGEKMHENQDEEEIENGLGIVVKKKTIYHGSGTSGIEQFNRAKEDTVGNGIYFTSEAKDAIGYARRRSRGREGASPVIYESSVKNMKLLDLRKDENVKKVLEGFKDILKNKLKDPDLKWNYEAVLQKAIEAINAGKVGSGNLRDITFSTGQMFSDYVKSLGYEGLVTFEGGEGDDVGSHDTYLVFDPEKVKINKENKIL